MVIKLDRKQSSSLTRNLALGTFGKFLIVFSAKLNLIYLLYSTTQRCCLLHLMKQNCFLILFLRTNVDDLDVSIPAFPSRTNMKVHNISVTPKMVKKIIGNLDL